MSGVRKERLRHVVSDADTYLGDRQGIIVGEDLNLRVMDGVTPGGHIIGGVNYDQYGIFNYNDSASLVTPIVVSPGVWTTIPNDTLSAQTRLDLGPTGIDGSLLWNVGNSRLEFSQLEIGRILSFRYDIVVTPTVNNTDIDVRLFFTARDEMGNPAFTFDLVQDLPRLDDGAGEEYRFVEHLEFFIGSEEVRLGDASFDVLVNEEVDLVNNGYLVGIF